MARTCFGRVPVCAVGRDAEQVLCLARPGSRVETSRFGSSSVGEDPQSAPGMGRELGLSAHARLFAARLSATEPGLGLGHHRAGDGKWYWGVIKDRYDGAIAAWQTSTRPTAEWVTSTVA